MTCKCPASTQSDIPSQLTVVSTVDQGGKLSVFRDRPNGPGSLNPWFCPSVALFLKLKPESPPTKSNHLVPSTQSLISTTRCIQKHFGKTNQRQPEKKTFLSPSDMVAGAVQTGPESPKAKSHNIFLQGESAGNNCSVSPNSRGSMTLVAFHCFMHEKLCKI